MYSRCVYTALVIESYSPSLCLSQGCLEMVVLGSQEDGCVRKRGKKSKMQILEQHGGVGADLLYKHLLITLAPQNLIAYLLTRSSTHSMNS